MRSTARVVIVGGGVMGISLLYHLGLEGWTDTILVEKAELTSGSTWHAAGQCPSFIANYNLAKVHAYSNDLYARLESMTGESTGWRGVGGIRFATTPEEVDHFRQRRGRGGQHRLPDAADQPRGDPADQPVRDHRRRAGRRLDAGRRLRRSVERVQRHGHARQQPRRHHQPVQPGHRDRAAPERRVPGARPRRATSPASTSSTPRAATRTASAPGSASRRPSPT